VRFHCPLTADPDGFLTQECPYCSRRFKAAFGKGSRKHLRYCPYCGIEGQNCWYTLKQIRYLEKVARGKPGRMPREESSPEAMHKFACHGHRIKHDGSASHLRCPACGKRSRVGG